jgi:THO complex subunit 2
VKALLDSEMATPLAILIGKQRDACIMQSDIEHLKLLSSLFDSVQETLLQYSDFLAANVDSKVYATILPEIDDLCLTYGLEPEVAWAMIRKRLEKLIKMHQPLVLVIKNSDSKELGETDDGTEDGDAMAIDAGSAIVPATEKDSVVEETDETVWQHGLMDTIHRAQCLLPPEISNVLRFVFCASQTMLTPVRNFIRRFGS